LAHTIGSGQISLRSALHKPLDNFLALMDGKHRRPAKTHPTGLSAGSTLTGAGPDQLPLKFGDTDQHGHEQPAMWRCGAHALRLSPRGPFSAFYYGIGGYAQFVGRNYDEAMRLARQGLRERVDFVGAHRVLTAAAGMAGRTEDTAAAPSAAQHFAGLDRSSHADQG
jgi:hypothetical protein